MNAQLLSAPPGEVRVAAGLVEAVASWDECAVLVGGAGTAAVLDRVERGLSARRVRCIRVRAPATGGLALPSLMAQIVGRADPGALTDDDLAAGFVALTEPGEGHDRVALLIDGAHALLPPAVRYVQLACRAGPRLRVVLAGRPGLSSAIAGDEFAYLRRRVTRRLGLPDPAADGPPDPLSTVPDAAPNALPDAAPGPAAPGRASPFAPVLRWRAGHWARAGLGLAASLALVAWTARRHEGPVPPVAPVRADAPAPGTRPGAAAPLVTWTTRWDDESAPFEASEAYEAPGPVEAHPGPVEARVDPPRAETVPPAGVAADAPGHDGPAESAAAARARVGEVPPSMPGPAFAAATPEPPAPPAEQGASPGATVSAIPVPEAPADPAAPAGPPEVDADARAQPPAAVVPERAEAAQEPVAVPARGAEQAAARAPEPPATRGPDCPPTPPEPAVFAALPVPPPPSRVPAATPPPPETPAAARRGRGGAERTAAPVAAPPAGRADERRCREIVLKTQLGEELPDADKRFLRGGCRPK